MNSLAALSPEILRRIRALILDVDGVLTDGAVIYSASGDEIKSFHARDGSALKYWLAAGRLSAWLSGRKSAALTRRARELGVNLVISGVKEKLPALQKICAKLKIKPEACAYMGDDLPDLPAMKAVGLAIAVADAAFEVRDAAAAVTVSPGGRGAVREVIEMLMKAQGAWQAVVARYTSGEGGDASAAQD